MLIDRFVTVLADTPAARDLHFHLRYKVFCQETGFEDATRFPDKKETDGYDRYATHFLVWDRVGEEWVGAMRLVPGRHGRLPSESICAEPLAYLEESRHRSAEFSRLCILAKHRQSPASTFFGLRPSGGGPQSAPTPVFYRQEDNEIFLRLLRASFEWGEAQGIDFCYFIVNPALARVLRRFGIPLEVVGRKVEHRGTRIPHRYEIAHAREGMLASCSGFARLVRNGPAYVPFSGFLESGATRSMPSRAPAASRDAAKQDARLP